MKNHEDRPGQGRNMQKLYRTFLVYIDDDGDEDLIFQTRITAQVKIHRETGVGARQLQTHFKAIDYAKRGDGQYDDAIFWQKFCRISTLQKFEVFPLGREKNLIYTPR